MPLIQYASFPSARMEAFYFASHYRDLAVIDFSTNGHGVYNFGHLIRLAPRKPDAALYSIRLTEIDIALGDFSRLYAAVEEAVRDGYINILLLPSSIGNVLGFDLKAYARDISDRLNIRMFTLPLKLSDDFYCGREEFMFAMAQFAEEKATSGVPSFNLLGGSATYRAQCEHSYLARLLSDAFGLTLNFDSCFAETVGEWNLVNQAQINVVTSRYALRTAEYLKKKFGTPYVYFYPIGKRALDHMLKQIADLLGRDYQCDRDEIYEFAAFQFSNILRARKQVIVCYADMDKVFALQNFLNEFGIEPQCYCTHKNTVYPYLQADDFIEKFRNAEVISISNDCVCKHLKFAISIEYIGLDYNLQVPLKDVWIGTEGAYRIMLKISKIYNLCACV